MLVRDEADTLPRTLPPMLDLVDTWTIIDTGSRDRTRDIASALCANKPGRLLERPWVNFAVNRTELLHAAAGHADWTLMLDADHTITLTGPMPHLEADSYMIPVTSGQLSWRLPLLTRSTHPFEYRGAAHSYLASDPDATSENTDWITVSGGPGATRAKLERDRILLEHAHEHDPDDSRTVFYLAQTHRDLGNVDKAVVFYRMRSEMRGWDEERYIARYELGKLLCEHVSFSAGADELLHAWRQRPHRVEALRALANAAGNVADKYPLPTDTLFVRPTDYRQEAAA